MCGVSFSMHEEMCVSSLFSMSGQKSVFYARKDVRFLCMERCAFYVWREVRFLRIERVAFSIQQEFCIVWGRAWLITRAIRGGGGWCTDCECNY